MLFRKGTARKLSISGVWEEINKSWHGVTHSVVCWCNINFCTAGTRIRVGWTLSLVRFSFSHPLPPSLPYPCFHFFPYQRLAAMMIATFPGKLYTETRVKEIPSDCLYFGSAEWSGAHCRTGGVAWWGARPGNGTEGHRAGEHSVRFTCRF